MSGLLGGGQRSYAPAIPAPTPAPPAPDRTDAEIQAAATAQRNKFFGAQGGRSDNMLTGGTGTETPSRAARFLGNVGSI